MRLRIFHVSYLNRCFGSWSFREKELNILTAGPRKFSIDIGTIGPGTKVSGLLFEKGEHLETSHQRNEVRAQYGSQPWRTGKERAKKAPTQCGKSA